jgi:enoyl-CoA hydratase/carnithine racemase
MSHIDTQSKPYEHVRVERQGRLLTITLARPKQLNSLHAPACFELEKVWDDFANDPDLWVAVVTGEGRAFCAGHDLADAPDEPMPPSGWAGMASRPPIQKPIIAAINGAAYGGGLEIALFADIRVIDENAKIALSEPKVGGIAIGGGSQRLVRHLPPAIAMEMLLTGRSMDAAEALRWGLVNEVVPSGGALEAARRFADRILACSPRAVQETKRLAMESLEGNLHRQIGESFQRIIAEVFTWADTREGIAAFLEKRPPVWSGR